MSKTATHRGQCFCGTVVLEAAGEPMMAGYCHCRDCREWSACPVTAWVRWPHAAVRVVKGAEAIASYFREARTPRAWCTKCGGHLGAFRPKARVPHFVGLPGIFPTLDFKPTLHVFCSEAVVTLDDDLPKYEGTLPR